MNMDDKKLENAVGGGFARPHAQSKDNCNHYEMRDSMAKQNPEIRAKSCSTCKHSLSGSDCDLDGESSIRP